MKKFFIGEMVRRKTRQIYIHKKYQTMNIIHGKIVIKRKDYKPESLSWAEYDRQPLIIEPVKEKFHAICVNDFRRPAFRPGVK